MYQWALLSMGLKELRILVMCSTPPGAPDPYPPASLRGLGKPLLHTLTLSLVHHFSFIIRQSENRNQAPDPRVSGIAKLVHFSYTCVSNTRKAESESCNILLLNTRCGTSWVQTNLFKRGLGPAARIWVQLHTVPLPREGDT